MSNDPDRSVLSRFNAFAAVVCAFAVVNLLGMTADIADLVTLPMEDLFFVVAIVVAILSLVMIAKKGYTDSTRRVVVGAITFLASGTVVGMGVVDRMGDETDPATAAPVPSASAASASPAQGDAKIISPSDGQELEGCIVPVRIQGGAAAGRVLVVFTKQEAAPHYFESKVEPAGSSQMSATVQLGQKEVTPDEDYAIGVIEMEAASVSYLSGILRNAAKDWGVKGQDEATYWNTDELPPGVAGPLHTINVHRAAKDDPSCPS